MTENQRGDIFTDDDLGRIAYAGYWGNVPSNPAHDGIWTASRDRYIAAARAVRDAVVPPGSVVIDRETAAKMAETLAQIRCMDHSCLFASLRRTLGYPPAVGTNGGCRCFQQLDRDTARLLRWSLGPLVRALTAALAGQEGGDGE